MTDCGKEDREGQTMTEQKGDDIIWQRRQRRADNDSRRTMIYYGKNDKAGQTMTEQRTS